MTILLVLNRSGARNVRILVRIPNENLEERFRILMDSQKYVEALEFAIQKAMVEEYLDPEKTYNFRPPEYTLVEDLIAARQEEKIAA